MPSLPSELGVSSTVVSELRAERSGPPSPRVEPLRRTDQLARVGVPISRALTIVPDYRPPSLSMARTSNGLVENHDFSSGVRTALSPSSANATNFAPECGFYAIEHLDDLAAPGLSPPIASRLLDSEHRSTAPVAQTIVREHGNLG